MTEWYVDMFSQFAENANEQEKDKGKDEPVAPEVPLRTIDIVFKQQCEDGLVCRTIRCERFYEIEGLDNEARLEAKIGDDVVFLALMENILFVAEHGCKEGGAQ